MTTEEKVKELHRRILEAVANLKLVSNTLDCSDCYKITKVYTANKFNLLYPRCRKCTVKKILKIRFADKSLDSKLFDLKPAKIPWN